MEIQGERIQKHEDGSVEVWRDVAGYEGHYRISNWGRVKSIKRHKPLILKYISKENWYYRVRLLLNGEGKDWPIHRLLWLTFRGPIPNGFEINHKDGNKRNNDFDNLELVTHSGNIKHAYNIGLIPSREGEGNTKAVLTDNEVLKIREDYANNALSISETAERFGVNRVTISYLLKGKTWDHIGGPIARGRLKSDKIKRVNGERVNTAKMTESQVREIRRIYECGGKTVAEIARSYSVNYYIISNIVKRKTWKHVI